MSKKVLLVDTNFSSRPIYDAIVSMGYEVHVVGGNPNDTLAKSAEYYWCLDYSDTNKLTELIKREKYNFIVPGCTDRSYTSCSIVCEEMDFPGIEPPENDRNINLKDKFRSLSQRLGISVPKVQKQSIELSYPLIVKPVDAFSGNGITVVKGPSELGAAIDLANKYSPSNSFVCEDYVDGQLFSHSAFVQSGRVIVDFIVREDSTAYPYAVDLSIVEPDFPMALLNQLRQSIETFVGALNLMEGLIHTQFILSDDQIYLIEMTRRCPGDLYSRLIELQTGFNYAGNYVRPFLGLSITVPTSFQQNQPVIRHTITAVEDMIFNGIKFCQSCWIESWLPLANSGDHLKAGPQGRAGLIFLNTSSFANQEQLYKVMLNRDLYRFL